MFLHFEDWTAPRFLAELDKKGMPHASRIIKVYATYQDPRQLLDRPALVVLESDHSPFKTDEAFHYEGRESYLGEDLETRLAQLGLQSTAKDAARSLFRFANRDDTQFCQFAMAAQYEGKWLFDHPFQDLDGIDPLKPWANKLGTRIHLDFFHPTSIERLRTIVNIDDTEQILGFKEHRILDQTTASSEGQRRSSER